MNRLLAVALLLMSAVVVGQTFAYGPCESPSLLERVARLERRVSELEAAVGNAREPEPEKVVPVPQKPKPRLEPVEDEWNRSFDEDDGFYAPA